jgi:hypothetical protein
MNIVAGAAEPSDLTGSSAPLPPLPSPTFPRWAWAIIPALAILAYVTVLRIGFLSDDYILLDQARYNVGGLSILLPRADFEFLRPVGTFLTWQLGWPLWGYNPLPYHIIGLLIHALAALFLALWISDLTRQPYTGWLAGALFAVYPINTEAVGWLASQWDVWAVMFGLLSLWLFTRWWRHPSHPAFLYWLSALAFGLGLFSKESLLAFLPVYALVVWFVTPSSSRLPWRRFFLAMIPFLLLWLSNIAIRFVTIGSIGGYSTTPTDYGDFFWDALLLRVRLLIAPINTLVLGTFTAQVVAALASCALLAGLIVYGRKLHRLLFLVLGLFLCGILPALNLYISPTDLGNNRLLYLPTTAYCILVAALLYEASRSLSRPRLLYATCLYLIHLCALTAWLQLRPWHTATVIADQVNNDLLKIIPPQQRPNGMVWYTVNPPIVYKGALILQLGLGNKRHVTTPDIPATLLMPPDGPASIDLRTDHRDIYFLNFLFDPETPSYRLNSGSGIAKETPQSIPTAAPGDDLLLWDFRQCAPGAISAWTIKNASTACDPGSGLLLDPTTPDPQLFSPPFDLQLTSADSTPAPYLVRLRISVTYPTSGDTSDYFSQWFWHGPSLGFREDHSLHSLFRQDGRSYVYWTFIPTTDIGPSLTNLRFDPANSSIPATIGWIAVDSIR